MIRSFPKLPRTVALIAAPLLLVVVATFVPQRSPAADDPATRARQVLTELESKRAAPALSGAKVVLDAGPSDAAPVAPSKPRPSPLDAAATPIAEARKALDKAKELRSLGDPARAELAEDAALEWALAARELVRAVEAEWEGEDQAALAIGIETEATKARKLLDDAIARRARLQTQIDELDKELAAKPLDAGVDPKAKKPKGGKK